MKTIFIISGGPGKEHEVSISSGKNIIENLNAEGIASESIIVTKDKKWVYNNQEMSEDEGLKLLQEYNALIFQIIHGTYGEDGELVSLFEQHSLSYIGSNAASLKLTIDKYKTEELLAKNAILTPSSYIMTKVEDEFISQIPFPVILKPVTEGSSVALYKVSSQEQLKNILSETIPVYGKMLAQDYISGREFTCGVVELDGEVTALPPTEVILTRGEIFDYEAKYTVDGCKEITPADIDATKTKKIKELAKRVHTLCDCKDISRTDMIMKANGELVVLEINTVPGMTKTSFIPAQLMASGYDVVAFLKGMVKKYEK